MPCLPEINSLVLRNVNESKETTLDLNTNTNGFRLEQPDVLASCEENKDPFAVFCNIPQPLNQDGLQTMCNLEAQTDDPESFFQKLVRGQNTSLDNLASIWESARLDSSAPWISVPDTSLRKVVDSNYYGLNLFNVQSLSVTDNAKSLIAMRDGWVVESNIDGLIHPSLIKVDATETFLKGPNTPNQSVLTSPRGAVRAALFSNAFYFFGNNAWLPDLTRSFQGKDNVRYQSMKMWLATRTQKVFVAIFYSYDSTETQKQTWNVDIFSFFDAQNDIATFTKPVTSITSLPNQNPFLMGFLAIQPNNEYLYWSTMNLYSGQTAPTTMQVTMCSLTDVVPVVYYNLWEITTPQSFLPSSTMSFYYNACLINGAIDPQNKTQIITMLFVFEKNMFQAKLGFQVIQSFQTITRGVRALNLSESLDHSRMMFVLDGTLRISCNLQQLTLPGQTFVLDDNNLRDAYVFALSPTQGTDVWIIRNTKLYRLNNVNQDPQVWGAFWTSDFPMYFAQEARISDFGLPELDKDVYVPSTSARWYLGTAIYALDQNPGGAQKLPFEAARSAHQTFRYIVLQVKTKVNNLQTFPFAIGELQRANEYVLAQNASSVTVDNDSNVTFLTSSSPNVLWESNTHDQVSSQEGRALVRNLDNAPYAMVSNNGLYLLYTIPQRRRLRLVFNPFNAYRMTKWCENDVDRLNQALQMQHDMCWQNLKIPDGDLFVDSRCACIGGPELFAIVAPSSLLQTQSLVGPLAEALPCFTASCNGGQNGFDETPTNVLTVVKERCSNRLLNIEFTSTDVQRGDLTKNGTLAYNQQAGLNRGGCSDLSPCDPGNTCVNGRCLAMCTSNAECQQLYGIAHSSCVDKICTPLEQPAKMNIAWYVYVAIAALVIVIICILVFVALVTKRKKNTTFLTTQQQQQQQTTTMSLSNKNDW